MPISQVFNIDCMEGMKQYPDKYFDLAVVDPPYGLGEKVVNSGGRFKRYHNKNGNWDVETPSQDYFIELIRASKNQIIWGGNYFLLAPTRCFLIWDKEQPEGVSFASCEYAWTSFDRSAKTFYKRPMGDNRIHPTQKPIELYDWIYKNYLPEGGKVIDTHLGSGSNRIAADKAGNIDFTAYELDKDYFEAQEKRWSNYKAQLKMFV